MIHILDSQVIQTFLYRFGNATAKTIQLQEALTYAVMFVKKNDWKVSQDLQMLLEYFSLNGKYIFKFKQGRKSLTGNHGNIV